MAWRASHVGFGDPANPVSIAYFRLLRPGGELTNWSESDTIVVHSIPGSFPPRTEIEVVSFGPAVVTWRLAFDSRTDLQRLRAQKGKTATLTMVAGIQSHIGIHEQIHGRAYERLPHTTLMALENEATPVGGPYEVDAIFLRTLDPDTGQAVAT